MNKAKYFWGFFFLTSGLLILNESMDLIYIDYRFIVKLYPLLIILIGLSVIAKQTFAKIISAVWGIFIPLYLYSLFLWMFTTDLEFDYQSNRGGPRLSTEQITPLTKQGDFKLKFNAGELQVLTNNNNIMSLKSKNDEKIENYLTYNNDSSHLYLYYTNKKIKINDDKYVKFDICNNFIWNLDWKVNFSDAIIKFDKIDFRKFRLKTTASNLEIYLDSSQIANQVIDINAKFSNIEIYIPENVFCNYEIVSTMSNVSDNLHSDDNSNFSDTLDFKITAFASNIEIINN